MNLGKISFLKRIYLAVTDFRMYPYTQKEKITKALGYFLKLLVFVSFIIAAFVTSNIFGTLPQFIDIYEEHMPNFNVINGNLQTTENISKEINNDVYLIVNSEYSYNQISEITIEESNNHNYYILSLSDSTVLGIRIEDTIQELARVQYEPEMNFDKAQLKEYFVTFKDSTTMRLSIWLGVAIGVFIVLLIIRTWTLIMYIISAYIINFMFGLKLKVSEYLKLVIYVSTMPIILETIALIMVGSISETINFISILVSGVYLFYALRAIKLDSLILGGMGKTAEEKIKNALETAQKELEKQLEELEEKEKNEQQKESDKKEIENLNNELKEKEENLLKAQKEYEEVMKKVTSFKEKNELKQDKKKNEEKNENEENK